MTGSVKGIKERIMLIAKRPKMARYTVMLLIVLVMVMIGCTYCGVKETDVGAGKKEESTESVDESTTEALITGETTTEEIVVSTEQPQIELSYQVEHSSTINYKDNDWDKHFVLFTSREDLDKLSGVDQRLNEKYSDEWFETHSFILFDSGHCSCCFVDLNRVEYEDGCLTISLNLVKTRQEDLYKEKGKDYVRGSGGNNHHADYIPFCFLIEFDKNGEEMLGLLEKVVGKVRDYPSSSWHEVELRLREPEPPVLELDEVPFIAKYRWSEKEKYRFVSEYQYGHEKWGNKVLVSSTFGGLQLCLLATKTEELRGPGEFGTFSNKVNIYTMFSLNPSYGCEVQKVSIEDDTVRIYADVVHKQWEELTEAERAEITSDKVDFSDETDENKYEMYLAIDSEHTKEYLELMRAVNKGVLILRNAMSGQTVEMELEFFSLIDKWYIPY
ncbi:MAG: hypothetical protein IJN46_01310 [Lachnospiraceae bacterium]|nr:hypothetical protein [Lachnospiraceae bacterium]